MTYPKLTLQGTLATASLLTACAQPLARPITYTCTGGYTTIEASYPDANTARLTLAGEDGTTKQNLTITRSASGARYSNSTTTPPKAGDLVWWTKGPEATLYIATPSETNTGTMEEKQIAVCTTP